MLSNKPKEHRYKIRTTGVTLLLDCSGSMQPRRDETIREVNRYLDNLKSDGQRYKVTVITFNEHTETLIYRKDIRDVGELEHSEYHPNGWTRLLDAVGQVLSGHGSSYPEERQLFCVITDGEENSSRQYGLQEVRNLIDRRRSEDFQFVFLGSGPGSWSAGRSLGFNWSIAADYNNPFNTENMYKGLYAASATMSSGGTLNTQIFNTNSTSAVETTKDK